MEKEKVAPNKEATAAAAAIITFVKTGNADLAQIVPLLNQLFAVSYRQGYTDCLAKLKTRMEAHREHRES